MIAKVGIQLKDKYIRLVIVYLAVIFILTILSGRSVLGNELNSPGVFDFSDVTDSTEFYIDLDGQWFFFEKALLTPNEVSEKVSNETIETVLLPNSFQVQTGDTNTFATYSAIIKIPKESVGKALAIHIPYQYSAYTLYADQEEIARNGIVGYDAASHTSEMAPQLGYFFAQSDEVLLTMQVSSFEHIRGGFENSIYLGEASVVSKKINTDIIGTLFVNGAIFIIGLFMVLFALNRRKEHVFLVFGIFSMLISARALFTVPFYYTLIFSNISWLWGTRLEYIFTEASSMFYVVLLWQWHQKEFSKKVLYGLVFIHIALIVTTLFTQPVFFQAVFFKVFYLTIPFFIYLVYVIYKSIRNHNKVAKVNLFGMGIVFLAFFNDFAIGNNWYQSTTLMLPAVAIYVVLHVFLMSRDFAVRTNKTEQQNKQLLALNASNEELAIQLQEEMKQKDNFLANTSHELRNPLHGIINIAQSILRNNQDQLDGKIQDDLSLQLSIGYHMSRTLEDLLDITRLKEHQIQLYKESLVVQAVSEGVIDMLRVHIENKDIEMTVRIAPDFPNVYADKTRLIQILYNLLHNAVKYTESGTIMVSANVEDTMAKIHVEDTGIGIDRKTLESIFEPYEQGDSGITAKGGGLGLGLSICHQLVVMHGGKLEANSVVDRGSVFTFTLPISKEPAKDVNIPIINSPMDIRNLHFEESKQAIHIVMKSFSQNINPANKLKILAVDDDAVNLRILKNILSKEQYDVEVVTDGKEVLKRLETKRWDLIISDVMMPNMSGYELTRSIREKFSISELPILLLTARGHLEDVYTGFLAGANDYVVKPVDAVELNVRVHALTDLQASINDRLAMEGAWLQAQIRPHFLFNTLNTIISLSRIDTERMVRLLERFSFFLQNSFQLHNTAEFIPLQDELDMIEAYLYIEQVRFGERLQIKWELDDVGDVLIPPLVVQTLVENAVNHGVLKRVEGGLVTIRMRPIEDRFEISVIDDGVGMDAEVIQRIFQNEPGSKRGIGMINTEARLQRLFGKGLEIMSTLDVGTTVTFTVPNTNLSN